MYSISASALYLSIRDMTRLGQLYLDKGNWNAIIQIALAINILLSFRKQMPLSAFLAMTI